MHAGNVLMLERVSVAQDAATREKENLSLFSLDSVPALLLIKDLTVLVSVFLFGAQMAHSF